MDIIIERARPSDAAALIAYLKQAGGETDNLTFGGEGLPISVEAEAAFIAGFEDSRDGILLVARDGDRIIGNANLSRKPRRMAHRGDFSISVLRDYWNRGVGGRLMSAVIAFARENGFEIIDLQVRRDNRRAIHLYEKFGFERLCAYPAFFKIGQQYVDFDIMCLRLDPAAE